MLVRKTVTVVFCDVTESTRLGETLDPETHRRVMSRYFEEMRGAIEHHGGTVEKFIGDAVMAVFGVPSIHEDDALRAVRAASDMRNRLRELNGELEEAFGLTLEMRIGVNTGEVVAGDPDSEHNLVTGDAVVVAKRLEEAAPPGQILIGKATYPLVRDAVDAGPLQTFPAKGKRDDVPSRRLDEVRPGEAGIARRLDAPLVGRSTELRRLADELERAERDRTCRLLTLLGPAGIGKSRLAQELCSSAAGRATTLTGRCLPYGDGITFWPLADVVRSAGGENAVRAVLGDDEDGRLAADRVLAGIGAAEGSASAEETFWGLRRYLETLARDRPVVLCLEDLHWAEPTLLDLVDYLAGWVHDSPLVILCLARPELLERRPAWSAPRENASILSLEPLSEAAAGELLAGIASEESLSADARARIAEAGEGNPLFLEQLAAMAAESDGAIAVPPSIQAVISERLDRLPREERTVIECAAVAGKQFLRGAVIDICPATEREAVGPALRELARKGLVRPDASLPGRDDGFRFGHVLIRDVAYEAMPKELRAELHERFPDWIEQNAADRALELEEIAAYHLEQAHRYRSELGAADERTRELGRRAASLLGRAGGRALDRGDMPAAMTLLERALALKQTDGGDRALLLTQFGSALMKTGRFEQAGGVLNDAVAEARTEGKRATELRATIERQFQRSFTAPDGAADEDRRVAEMAIPELEQLDAPRTLARAWWLLSESHVIGSRWGERAAALEQAIAHAQRAPEGGADVSGYGALLAQALYYGPTPVAEAIARCEELRSAAYGPGIEAALGTTLAALHAMEGRFDDARALYAESIEAYERLGLHFSRAARSHLGAQIELLGGDPPAAARELQVGYETLEAMGEQGVRSTLAGFLADVLCTVGDEFAAQRFTALTEQAAGAADLVPQVLWRRARARLEARGGDREHALVLAREAVDRSAKTDYLDFRGDTLVGLAEVLIACGHDREATAALGEAKRMYERKGNTISARNAMQPRFAWTPGP